MIISRTPVRMSFAGGGSDLRAYYRHRPGSVLSTTINKYIYITVNHRFSDKIRVAYSKVEDVDSIHSIEHNLVREALKKTGITKGVDVVYMSDLLPANEGSGLGASSSLIVGTLHALYAYQGKYVSAKTLAEQACEIEIEVLGHPIGKQDQYAAAFGGLNFIQFNPDETVTVERIIMSPETSRKLQGRLVAFHTGVNTRSDSVLTEQKAKTEQHLPRLDAMVGLSHKLKEALRKDDLHGFGKILHEGWQLKRQLASNMSNSGIDALYEHAIAAGALGGKILGSGGGGFLLFYCEEEKQPALRKALAGLRELDFRFESEGSRIIYIDENHGNRHCKNDQE